MGVFQIIFIAVNLSIPYWLWSRSSREPEQPKIKWEALGANLHRILESSGGYTCAPSKVVDRVRELCEQSEEKLTDKTTLAFEQIISNMLYRCEVKKSSVAITITPLVGENGDEEMDDECTAFDSYQTLAMNPEFLFTYSGFVNRMSFSSGPTTRQMVLISNCRKKLKVARSIAAADQSEFVERLGQLPNDPSDFHSANRLCLIYDSAPGWMEVRQQYLEKSE
jgi:hypothetical protein